MSSDAPTNSGLTSNHFFSVLVEILGNENHVYEKRLLTIFKSTTINTYEVRLISERHFPETCFEVLQALGDRQALSRP